MNDTLANCYEKLHQENIVDPTGFDITVTALLLSIEAEKYIDIFKKLNIGQSTLVELNDEDLIKIGIDDPKIRIKLIEEVKKLPVYEELKEKVDVNANFSLINVNEILEESSNHLHRIYLSLMANTLAIKKKKKNIPDCLIYKDKYATDAAINAINEITSILNSVDCTLCSRLQISNTKWKKKTIKKTIVAVVGSIVVGLLTSLFVKSLKK